MNLLKFLYCVIRGHAWQSGGDWCLCLRCKLLRRNERADDGR